MGQLTNLYVSESYQGLVKLENSTTGVTGTLQYLEDGLGNNLPIQMSTGSVNITGSLFINNVPFTGSTNGSSGTSGTSGINGSSGTSGVNGTNGSSGTSGTSGVSGSAGTSGTSGGTGSSGTSGTSGQDGSSGTSGGTGSSGTSGTSGVNGSSGTSGIDGSSGTSGTSGTSGSSGISPSLVGVITTGSMNTSQTISGSLSIIENGSFGRFEVLASGSSGIISLNGSLTSISGANFINLTSTGGLVNISGSAGVNLSGSLTKVSSNLFNTSNNTTVPIENYLTSSQAGQVNIIKGWSDSPTTAGVGALQSNYTGSIRITGSNNIVSMPQIRATGVGGGVDQQGYISGSDNTLASNGGGIYLNTGSLLFPKTNNNYVGANAVISMNFTTSSLAGGHPLVQNNTLYAGALFINHNSGSVSSLAGNLLNGGQLTSTQNFVTNQRAQITGNQVGSNVTLNHLSSSINYAANWNNAPITINNAVSSSIAQNTLTTSNNLFLGAGPHAIFASGSQSSNVTRTMSSNLIGGINNVVSSSFVSSSNSNLQSTIIYGNNLAVSASHTAGTTGGSAFFGRFNMTGSNLEDTQQVVFAVGTGTSAGARRTTLLIDSGSNVRISGSLIANNTTNALVVTGSSNITHNIAGQPSLTLVNSVGSGQPALDTTGSVSISGSLRVNGNESITGSLFVSGNYLGTVLTADGTIDSRRLHFTSNPFNTNPSSNLGAIRFNANNDTFQITNYDTAQITTQSYIDMNVLTGSLTTYTQFGAKYSNTDGYVKVTNLSGTTTTEISSSLTNIISNTQITGSLAVTGSVSIANAGDLTMYGHKMFNVGAFSSTQTQSGSANVSQSINYNTTDISQGVSVVAGSQLTIANAGVYNIQFSAQLLADTGADDVHIWLKKNGTNIANSAGRVTLANNEELMAAWNYVVEAAAGDYYELVWESANGDALILYEAATGNYPAVTSIITTVTQVR